MESKTENKTRLTQYSHGAGCGCKISPDVLNVILKNNESQNDYRNLLVGNQNRDDAAVYDLGNGTALISTADFFMPVVDDAFQFGMIAAANAIGDIYAMGGKPLMAIAILGWPVEKLSPGIAQQVVAGGRKICEEASIPLAGGHSIDSTEPIFGLSVSGIIQLSHLKKNSTAKKGDLLFLTKPLGTGIITSAAKKNVVREPDLNAAINSMCELNRAGAELGKIEGVNAMTDVTGFGLLGHLSEMCEGSNCTAEIYFDKLPLLPGLDFYLDQFIYPDMTTKIFSGLSAKVNELTARQLFITCDPQTNGGLLVSVSPESVREYKNVISKLGLPSYCEKTVGKIKEGGEKLIEVI